MIVDGKKIAADMREELAHEVRTRAYSKSLAIVRIGSDPVAARYTGMKKRFGESIGIAVIETALPESVSQLEVEDRIRALVADQGVGGIIVQLPLPRHLDTRAILDLVSPQKDVDVLSSEAYKRFVSGAAPAMPAVAGAINEILKRSGVDRTIIRTVVVVGHGALVGKPVADWLAGVGSKPIIVDIATPDISAITREADLIVSGVGKPGLIAPVMLKDGVILIDAGTSEADSKLAGDASPECASRCALFTPVPGGVGPVTVAILFKNLLALASR